MFLPLRGTRTRQMSTTHATHATEPSRIEISNHARFRVMERLGVVERAAEHVRELLADAVRVEDDRFPACRAFRADDVTIVVDSSDDVVMTVVVEADR